MRRVSLPALACAVLMALPGSSGAQGLPSDPEADSPPGVVYEIPVEKGRRDAAPRRGTEPDTSIRSENNFGTSSEVPGVPAGGGTGAGWTPYGEIAGETAAGQDQDGNDSGGSGSSDSGSSGSGSSDPGAVEDIARDTGGAAAAAADGPSEGVVYPLLAVLVAVGAAIGLFAGHRARHGSRG